MRILIAQSWFYGLEKFSFKILTRFYFSSCSFVHHFIAGFLLNEN